MKKDTHCVHSGGIYDPATGGVNKTDAEKPFNSVGFGIWKGRGKMKNVKKWLDERRNERYQP